MRAARTDANQTQIVRKLRQMGHSVAATHTVGNGFGDIVVGIRGQNYLFEIKDPTQPPSARKLTPPEVKFHSAWRGQIDTILTAEEAHEIIMRQFGEPERLARFRYNPDPLEAK